MTERVRGIFFEHRARILPVFLALTLVAAVIVTIFTTQNARADYVNCGYGYSFGGLYGSGAGFGYGNNTGGEFGYGNTVCGPLAMGSSLPTGTAGASYNEALSGSGGTGIYTWSGGPQDGLAISSNGTVSGTPTGSGNFTFTVTLKDSNLMSITGPVTLSVVPIVGGTTTTTTAPTTTTTSPTTTTTAPTTTTTAPTTTTTAKTHHRRARLYISRIVGRAVAGRTRTLTVLGGGFFGAPKVTSNAKYRVIVTVSKDFRVRLIIHVRSVVGVHGWHTLTFRLANGRVVRRGYLTLK